MKLKSSIPSNSVKIIDLYNKIISGNLITGPDYQRKLVWKKQHKVAFIETILMNFPFPEIYIASADLDLKELKAREVVVDGQQRLTTIVDYIQGRNDFKDNIRTKSFDELSEEEKRDFLNYLITVKDLKDIGQDNIIEVFKRINSTNYSLNSNEVLNAQFGGGEFAIFCKILADRKYMPSTTETSVVLDSIKRDFINSFFEKNNVFSDNDMKRMFDSQYIMLICSTILEGQYFGRSSKINEYLEKYNDEFAIFDELFDKIYNSLWLIDQLKLSDKSYWFNKANLFTLIIELSKNKEELDLNLLELKLIDLENKVDVYFMGGDEDTTLISSDEMKYFELARQGSHELNARLHRGEHIKNILRDSKKEIAPQKPISNFDLLKEKGINYAVLIPTATGISKSIMDATLKVREFLKLEKIHTYETQGLGSDHKVKINAAFIDANVEPVEIITEVSLYRSNGRGDFRIWFSGLNEYANDSDVLILINHSGLKILNTTKFDYSEFIKSL